jgi:hypothetical protein
MQEISRAPEKLEKITGYNKWARENLALYFS